MVRTESRSQETASERLPLSVTGRRMRLLFGESCSIHWGESWKIPLSFYPTRNECVFTQPPGDPACTGPDRSIHPRRRQLQRSRAAACSSCLGKLICDLIIVAGSSQVKMLPDPDPDPDPDSERLLYITDRQLLRSTAGQHQTGPNKSLRISGLEVTVTQTSTENIEQPRPIRWSNCQRWKR